MSGIMKMGRGLLIVAVTLGVAASFAVPSGALVAAESAESAVVTTPWPAEDNCDIKCQHCVGGEGTWHVAWYGEPQEWQKKDGSHPSECFEGSCAEQHGDGEGNGCTILEPPEADLLTTADLETLRAAVVSENAKAVEALLIEHPSRLVLNQRRHAIQVFDCRGSVSAHIAIPAEFTAVIATSLSMLDR